jgi:hypothetical protein
LEDVPLNVRLHMWLQHDGAPPRYSCEVSQWVSENYPGRGCAAPISWPTRSPDLNSLDFFLWGYLKTTICASAFDTREELWPRIRQFGTEIKNTPEIFQRVRVYFSSRVELCVREHGGHFEHLLQQSKNEKVTSIPFLSFLLIHKPLT